MNLTGYRPKFYPGVFLEELMVEKLKLSFLRTDLNVDSPENKAEILPTQQR
jgi:hypothetical protein